jgi:hypothetical protein
MLNRQLAFIVLAGRLASNIEFRGAGGLLLSCPEGWRSGLCKIMGINRGARSDHIAATATSVGIKHIHGSMHPVRSECIAFSVLVVCDQ